MRVSVAFISDGITDGALKSRLPAKTEDAEASLRENLRAQLASAQAELSANLIELRRGAGADANIIAQGDAQLGALLALKRQLDSAGPATLAMIRADISACVAAATSTAQLAHAAVSIADQHAATADLAAASEAARAQVASFNRDFYERKIFDPYLKFESPEDEEAYRKREADIERQIKQAQALHTPTGDLLATRLAIAQLKDAGAHGADKSPDYQRTMEGLTGSESKLSAAVAANAPSPKKSQQGSTPTDPLDAIKPSIAPSLDEIAGLKSAGVLIADQEGTGHGVSANAKSASTLRARG